MLELVGDALKRRVNHGITAGVLSDQSAAMVRLFTGLATALFLAREHGIRATVLEANRVAWGCTSRNGGQGQNASGRLYRSWS